MNDHAQSATTQARRFDAAAALATIRAHREISHHQRLRRSRLERFRAELVELVSAGASSRELSLWLRRERNTLVHSSTVWRYVRKLPELQPVAETLGARDASIS